ncbi:axoneme-associated protein mst101(1)-like [Quercus lobata]|uniref:axoneme-associated protein mst101(1)-like n=1 Tax=Quercus lobata TaxID=97700 RepID=UPI0012486679|nr:axoneme-associated protein mst101(1)-like [Quercus lobata]
MALNKRKGLRDIMAGKNKASTLKEKKRKDQELEEGEVVPQKGAKQQKTAKNPKDRRATSANSKEEPNGAEGGHSAHIVEALEQPLLLPKDIDALRRVRQPDLFLSLKRDLAMITQKVFVAEEWVKEVRNDVKNEAHLHVKAEKSLRATKQKCKELASKLIAEERKRRSAEAGLKNAQLVLELKSDLQKAKEAAQAEKEAAEASKQVSYLLGIKETEIRLAEELVEVCKDYCKVTWEEALNLAGVPTNSKC